MSCERGLPVVTSDAVKARAVEVGFDLCGVAPVGEFPELSRLPLWLRRGYGGTMTYLNRSARVRADVRHILPSARSVVVVACNYLASHDAGLGAPDPREAVIARYARGEDYHDVMGRRLDAVLEWMRDQTGPSFEGRRYVDSGPVQERVYARYAGLGWIGKNACLIHPSAGSWLLLGEIICNVELAPDTPEPDRCGTCGLCIEACPTRAIVAPGMLDARRCLSYLTIEFNGTIPEERRADLGAHVFGCDRCQEVCPWNAAVALSTRVEWRARPLTDRPRLASLWSLPDAEMDRLVSGSALDRAGITGLRRNLAVALGNSGDAEAAGLLDAESVAGRAGDAPSLGDPRVLEHAAWAAGRLGPPPNHTR
jgi:epoxyqueuosine reductase